MLDLDLASLPQPAAEPARGSLMDSGNESLSGQVRRAGCGVDIVVSLLVQYGKNTPELDISATLKNHKKIGTKYRLCFYR